MILFDGIVVGVILGLLRGGSLANLVAIHLRGEGALVAALVAQLLLPRLLSRTTMDSSVALAFWLLLMGAVLLVALANARLPGMVLLAVGVSLNVIVIVLNGAMPVSVEAIVRADRNVDTHSLVFSSLHEPLDGHTQVPLLADVVGIPGPPWHRGVVSVGDVVLVVGLGTFVQSCVRGKACAPVE